MGKKKDKASKSKKKKSSNEPVLETETSIIEPKEPEPEHESESEPGNIQYAEYVTAQDVVELVDSLSHDIEQLDKTNQSLQKEITQNHKKPQWQSTALLIIALILGIGIFTVVYTTAKVNALMDQNMGIVSARIDNMKLQLETMNTSMISMSGDLNTLNTRLDVLSANVSTVDQNVAKIATDASAITTQSQPYDAWRAGRQPSRRSPWR